jgi:hypothetical protein
MNMRSLFFPLHRGVQKYKIRELTKASVATAFGLSLFAHVAIAADKPADPKTWAGIGWGLGVAADFDLGGKRVADAQIINGLVRIKDSSSNVGVSFVLETHYFFKEWLPNVGTCLGFNCNDVAIGPFIAVEIGGGTSATTNAGPITGYALGGMVGFHHPDFDPNTHKDKSTSSWNFGVGLRVDPQAKVLGDGFVANQPPPAGETAIRTKTEPRYGLMLLSSFSF